MDRIAERGARRCARIIGMTMRKMTWRCASSPRCTAREIPPQPSPWSTPTAQLADFAVPKQDAVIATRGGGAAVARQQADLDRLLKFMIEHRPHVCVVAAVRRGPQLPHPSRGCFDGCRPHREDHACHPRGGGYH